MFDTLIWTMIRYGDSGVGKGREKVQERFLKGV